MSIRYHQEKDKMKSGGKWHDRAFWGNVEKVGGGATTEEDFPQNKASQNKIGRHWV